MKKSGRHPSCGIIGTFALVGILVIPGCQSTAPVVRGDQRVTVINVETVEQSAPQLPGWALRPPAPDAENHYFVGVSENASTEKLARNSAYTDAIYKAIQFSGVKIRRQTVIEIVGKYRDSEVKDPLIHAKDTEKIRVAGFISRVSQIEFYQKILRYHYSNGSQKIAYNDWVLVSVPRTVLQEMVATQQAKRYQCLAEGGAIFGAIDDDDLAGELITALQERFQVTMLKRGAGRDFDSPAFRAEARRQKVCIVSARTMNLKTMEITDRFGSRRPRRIFNAKGILEIRVYDLLQNKYAGTFLINDVVGIGFSAKDAISGPSGFYYQAVRAFSPVEQ